MTLTLVLLLFKSLLLAVVCVVAAVSDLKTGKVTNCFLLVSLFIAGTVTIVCSLVSGIWPWEENEQGFLFIWNILLTFVISIGFYGFDVWAPGDSKMFMVIAVLFPPLLQATPSGAIFPSLQIIVWMFSIGFLYLALDSLLHPQKRLKTEGKKGSHFKGGFRWVTVWRILAAYSFSLLVYTFLSTLLPTFYEANRTLCVLAVILCALWIGKQPRWFLLLLILLSSAGVLLYPAAWGLVTSFSFGALLPWIVAILTGLLSQKIRKSNYLEIAPEQLRAGMILSLYSFSRFPQKELLPPARMVESRRSRLDPLQANSVMSWAVWKHEPILIISMIPFAPFIAAGTIFELLLGWFRLIRESI